MRCLPGFQGVICIRRRDANSICVRVGARERDSYKFTDTKLLLYSHKIIFYRLNIRKHKRRSKILRPYYIERKVYTHFPFISIASSNI